MSENINWLAVEAEMAVRNFGDRWSEFGIGYGEPEFVDIVNPSNPNRIRDRKIIEARRKKGRKKC
ncbi:hypothetical protein KKA15_06315 [Patescibacteria group bacterium]|nr:hypothetical protein [Patescibacteria group bacterium]